MYAIKATSLITNIEHYTAARNYCDACEKLRQLKSEMEPAWEEGVDYEAEIIEVDEDFDFDDQPDWN